MCVYVYDLYIYVTSLPPAAKRLSLDDRAALDLSPVAPLALRAPRACRSPRRPVGAQRHAPPPPGTRVKGLGLGLTRIPRLNPTVLPGRWTC